MFYKMSRPVKFRQSDVARALKAARGTGATVKVEIEPDGKPAAQGARRSAL
jgi:hypothetical protein